MRLIRRRTKASLPSDVLDRISILLAECRTSSTQEQIVELAVDLLGRLVPSDSLLVLGYPAERQTVEILHARGVWKSLSRDAIKLEPQPNRPDPVGRMRGLPLDDALGKAGNNPLRMWTAPLRVRDRSLGSVWLGRRSALSRDYSPQERRIAGMIADILGCELFHWRLIRQSENLNSQLQAMRSVERAITSSMDLSITLNVFLDHVLRQLHADAASVLLMEAHGREMAVAASRGFRRDRRPHSKFRPDHTLATQAGLERKTVSVEAEKPGDPALDNQPLMKEEGFASYSATPLIAHGRVRGILEVFHRTAAEPASARMDLLDSLAQQAAIAIDCADSYHNLQRTQSELSMACDSMIEGFSRAVDLRAREAEGHSLRVSELSIRTAEKMGVSQDQIPALRRGALLHDIGKIGIPDRILWKPEALTEEEWELMRQHPKLGEQVLAPIEFLRSAMDIPKFHHERWDGGGYPYGLAGSDIPLPARIFSVVDVWDSLQARRPFRAPWNAADTTKYLQQASGRQFDPEVVRTFMQILGDSES
ncbi:MAG: GAF domain-containing protein [Anaerolineales bacterium]|nr:GAF domain-containing protein [Anaerolineales bacterium]